MNPIYLLYVQCYQGPMRPLNQRSAKPRDKNILKKQLLFKNEREITRSLNKKGNINPNNCTNGDKHLGYLI